MSRNHHRSPARGGPGYLCWSVLNGTATLHMPWSDILSDGRVEEDHLSDVYRALGEFERRLREREFGDETMPPMPTPNARVIHLDNSTFSVELAERVTAYKKRLKEDTYG